jgi:two-component system CheB/CheR fusion protein
MKSRTSQSGDPDLLRRKAEEISRKSELHFRNLANCGQALIWTSGKDTLCDYFNEPWLDFTGRTLEQELGNGWLEGVHAEDLDRCIDTYMTAFDRHEPFSMEYRLRHVSGEFRWLVDQGMAGMDDCISKPFDRNKLAQVLGGIDVKDRT